MPFVCRSRRHFGGLRPLLAGTATVTAVALSSAPAWAGPNDAILLPTVTPRPWAPDEREPTFVRPEELRNRWLSGWAHQLDVVLGEAAQDLGLTLDVSGGRPLGPEELSEAGLVAFAQESWVISPRIEAVGAQLRVRIVAVPPGSQVLLSRSLELEPEVLELRTMVMLRDLVRAGRGTRGSEAEPREVVESDNVVSPARSAGRAVLALNAAVFGGYIGLSLQHASGSEDPRLTYPMVALGSGIGLGASMIVADEWDVGLGDAWYLAAGAWWPLTAGWLLAESYDVEPSTDRYAYGLAGAAAGITLATTALTFRPMGDGGASLAHSGGALGVLLGALTQMAYEGSTELAPTRGMGYGAALGVLGFGALATQIRVPASRVLFIDLAASLGALTGAAVASPLLLAPEDQNETAQSTRERLWIGGVGAGLLVGASVGYLLTKPAAETPAAPTQSSAAPGLTWRPEVGAIARDSRGRLAYGLGLSGTW